MSCHRHNKNYYANRRGTLQERRERKTDTERESDRERRLREKEREKMKQRDSQREREREVSTLPQNHRELYRQWGKAFHIWPRCRLSC